MWTLWEVEVEMAGYQNLAARLRQFIESTVQVAVSENESPVEGQLVSVSTAAFTVQTAPTGIWTTQLGDLLFSKHRLCRNFFRLNDSHHRSGRIYRLQVS